MKLLNKITAILFVIMLFALYSARCSEPEIEIVTDSVKCYNENNGGIYIKIYDISQEYTAQIYKYNPGGNPLLPVKENNITSFNASNLNAGKYFIEIKGNKGFSFTKSIGIFQPDKFGADKISVEKKLSSPEANDAVLKANPAGGTPPYTYSWNIEGNDKNSSIIKNVKQGIYSCLINDVNNCGPVKMNIIFNQYVDPEIVENQN